MQTQARPFSSVMKNCFLNWFQLAKNSRVFAKPILGQAQQTLVGDNMGK